MKQIQPDLWQSRINQHGMLSRYAYLLATKHGNVLFYHTTNKADVNHIQSFGGINYQLLSNRDEATSSLLGLTAQLAHVVCASKLEQPYIRKFANVNNVFNSVDYKMGDIEIIHTPGHTDGSVCFYYRSPFGKDYLFSGDTLFPWDGNWTTLVRDNAGGNHNDLLNSVNKLGQLTPNFIFSSSFVGDYPLSEFTEQNWRALMDKKRSKLENELELYKYQLVG